MSQNVKCVFDVSIFGSKLATAVDYIRCSVLKMSRLTTTTHNINYQVRKIIPNYAKPYISPTALQNKPCYSACVHNIIYCAPHHYYYIRPTSTQ